VGELPREFDPETFQGVVITHGRVMCGVHSSPFQHEWPRGYAVYAIELIRESFADKRIVAEAQRLAGLASDAKIDPKMIEPVLDIRPACCRLARPVLIKVYEKCGVGVIARCNVCKRKRKGTPIAAENVTYSHCCFACISDASATPWGVH